MKQSIRFFSLGLITSAIFLYGFFLFSDISPSNLESVPVDTLISQIETDGYRVITEDEFISFSLLNDEDKDITEKEPKKEENKPKDEPKKENADDEKEKEDKEEKADEVKKVTFTNKQGVVSQDIADILIENKIIDDRQKFLDYLDKNDYSPYIQLGKFEVTSDMGFKEIAEVITTYPGNN